VKSGFDKFISRNFRLTGEAEVGLTLPETRHKHFPVASSANFPVDEGLWKGYPTSALQTERTKLVWMLFSSFVWLDLQSSFRTIVDKS